jgi:hypothetical protein
MIKIIVSVFLVLCGIYTLGFWAAGSHGHIMFRPHMTEDWVLSSILLVCFGIPLFLLVRRLRTSGVGGRR